MLYRFKKNIGTTERVEVMKIIKYTVKKGYVSEESLEAHPELKEYFEPVEDES